MLLVKKTNAKPRTVVAYQRLNQIAKNDKYPRTRKERIITTGRFERERIHRKRGEESFRLIYAANRVKLYTAMNTSDIDGDSTDT